mmetsp:Transcript_42050/g.91239  ORF Transcript_42050/g.91239 Transcript_42050/m.91239 type:complete len:246 (+) Transcript_42050:151-888(+)
MSTAATTGCLNPLDLLQHLFTCNELKLGGHEVTTKVLVQVHFLWYFEATQQLFEGPALVAATAALVEACDVGWAVIVTAQHRHIAFRLILDTFSALIKGVQIRLHFMLALCVPLQPFASQNEVHDADEGSHHYVRQVAKQGEHDEKDTNGKQWIAPATIPEPGAPLPIAKVQWHPSIKVDEHLDPLLRELRGICLLAGAAAKGLRADGQGRCFDGLHALVGTTARFQGLRRDVAARQLLKTCSIA